MPFTNSDFDCAPTYQQLKEWLATLTDDQLEIKMTVELDLSGECVPAMFDITGHEHDSLDEDVPVIRIRW
jgi:hypothetical protein